MTGDSYRVLCAKNLDTMTKKFRQSANVGPMGEWTLQEGLAMWTEKWGATK